jgi:hypothetical protein
VASALGLCPHFSVEDYYFPVDDVQQPEMFANAELDAPESFRGTKLVPFRQHNLVTKYHIAHFTIGIIFHGNDTLRYKISSKQ